eukprot:gene41812-51801_t
MIMLVRESTGNIFNSCVLQNSQTSINSCDWSQFAGLTTRLPQKNVYFSTLTLTGGQKDFETGVTKNNTFTCTKPTLIAALLSSLNDQDDYSVICDGVAFRVEK